MKKDLDFIKNKLAESKVKAPDDMDESFVIDVLGGDRYIPDAQPVIVGFEAESRRMAANKKRRVSAMAAAAVVLIGALSVALGTHFSSKPNIVTMPGGLSLRRFKSSAEVMSAVKDIREKNGLMSDTYYLEESSRSGVAYNSSASGSSANGSVDSYASSSSGSQGSAAAQNGAAARLHSETYKQVDGVDEADIIKTDGRYIYCADYSYPDSIVIFSAKGDNSEKLAEINPGQTTVSTPDEAKLRDGENSVMYRQDVPPIQELYLRNDRLIVICAEANYSKESFTEATEVFVYDISDIGKIELLDSMKQSGYYSSSRMIGDTLYTVSDYMTSADDVMPVCGGGSTPDEIPADCIYSLYEPDEDSFLVLSAYDTLDHTAQTKSKAILGKVEDIYCSENNMYIYSTLWEDYEYNDDIAVDFEDDYRYNRKEMIKTRILKVDLTDGINFTAYAEINGRINDQYSLDEKDGYLRVATTSYRNLADSNNIFVLDSKLATVGSATNIAWDESIEAVRYVGDTAYMITYRQTDPLFVIDLSDPSAPEVLGNVEISGFSTMLIPIDDSTVLGLGYHSESSGMNRESGFKLALFDVSDKTAPQVLDSKSYVDYNSAVMEDPKALVYNPDRDDYVVPLNYEYYGNWIYDEYEDAYEYQDGDNLRGGMLNFAVEGGKIVEKEMYAADCDAVDRCVYVGDHIYMTYYGSDGLDIISKKYK